jgi:hypothetical protein
MGNLFVFDGPEKSGKSTIIREIAKIIDIGGVASSRIVKWGPVEPDDRVYAEAIKTASNFGPHTFVLWDRSWAAEHVYAAMLNRDRRLKDDPWLGEWLHGRAASMLGGSTMVFSPSAEWSIAHRDDTDLQVDPHDERRRFFDYATVHNWHRLAWKEGDTPTQIAKRWIRGSLHLDAPYAYMLVNVPWYAGPPNAKVVVIGEGRSTHESIPGGWLPFTSTCTTKFARLFGNTALKMGWTNSFDCPPYVLHNRDILITCGDKAYRWTKNFVGTSSSTRIIKLNHPAFVFRWGNNSRAEQMFKLYESAVMTVKQLLD